jgi:hypothetical protein
VLTEQYLSYIHYKKKIKKKRVQQVEQKIGHSGGTIAQIFPTKKEDKMGMIENFAMQQNMNYS